MVGFCEGKSQPTMDEKTRGSPMTQEAPNLGFAGNIIHEGWKFPANQVEMSGNLMDLLQLCSLLVLGKILLNLMRNPKQNTAPVSVPLCAAKP